MVVNSKRKKKLVVAPPASEEQHEDEQLYEVVEEVREKREINGTVFFLGFSLQLIGLLIGGGRFSRRRRGRGQANELQRLCARVARFGIQQRGEREKEKNHPFSSSLKKTCVRASLPASPTMTARRSLTKSTRFAILRPSSRPNTSSCIISRTECTALSTTLSLITLARSPCCCRSAPSTRPSDRRCSRCKMMDVRLFLLFSLFCFFQLQESAVWSDV